MSKTIELNIPRTAEERAAQHRPCPLCFSGNLHEFSHWTSCGMREVKKIMCRECQCEAPLIRWNVRVQQPR